MEKTVGADGRARKQPAKKIKVNGHAIEADDLSPAAHEQIAKALERPPEETRGELERLHALTSSMATEIAHIDDPDTTFDSAWHEATTEVEKLDTENKELRAEIERLKALPEAAPTTPAVVSKLFVLEDRMPKKSPSQRKAGELSIEQLNAIARYLGYQLVSHLAATTAQAFTTAAPATSKSATIAPSNICARSTLSVTSGVLAEIPGLDDAAEIAAGGA